MSPTTGKAPASDSDTRSVGARRVAISRNPLAIGVRWSLSEVGLVADFHNFESDLP